MDRPSAIIKILGTLGTGGMGEGYLAKDTRLGRNIALKLLPRDFAADEHQVAKTPPNKSFEPSASL
ncbi:MAG: hypothetical protein H0V18_16230 [Pyrinomonadaceae bacterium]|nr:hypothetical protein [Pyrinomonadaceae bacterium]